MWCEIVTDLARLDELSSEWRRLTSDCHADIFQQWAWARAHWKAHGAGSSLCSPVVHQQDRIVGILPLVRRDNTIEFLGSPEADYNDLICEEGCAAPALELALNALLRLPVDWTTGAFENLSAHSRIVRHLDLLPRSLREHLQLVYLYTSSAVALKQNKTEILTKLVRKDQLKRYHQKLQKIGSVTFRHIETREEAREHLQPFFHQHVTRCAMNGLRSQFLQPERRAFHEALIEELDPSTELRFGVLELDARPIAYHFGFLLDGRFTWYEPTFNVNYWDYCPGDVLLRTLFQYSQQASVDEFDFSIGDEGYKSRYANQVDHNYAVYIDRHPARLTSRCRQVARQVKHIVRQRPEMLRTLKRSTKWIEEKLQQVITSVRRDGLLQSCANGLRTAFRKAIWARDAWLVFSSDLETLRKSSLGLTPATLEMLASLSLEHHALLSAEKLRDCRNRLKRGDRAYVVHGGKGEVSILWVATQSGVSIPDTGQVGTLSLGSPAIVIYEVWTTPGARASSATQEVLRALIAQNTAMPVWIYCRRENKTLRQAILDAGFQLRHRVVSRVFLHSLRRTQVLAPAEIKASQQEQLLSPSA